MATATTTATTTIGRGHDDVVVSTIRKHNNNNSMIMDQLHWVKVTIHNNDKKEWNDDDDDDDDDDDNNNVVVEEEEKKDDEHNVEMTSQQQQQQQHPIPHNKTYVWWPCIVFDDYGPFQSYYGDEINSTMDVNEKHEFHCQMCIRTMDNMLHSRRVRIGRLLGRPLFDYVEIIDDNNNVTIQNTLKDHLDMSQITCQEQMNPQGWFYLSLDDNKSKGEASQQRQVDDADEKCIETEIYLSYMAGLDELFRIVQQATTSSGSSDSSRTRGPARKTFVDKGRTLLDEFFANKRMNNGDTEEVGPTEETVETGEVENVPGLPAASEKNEESNDMELDKEGEPNKGQDEKEDRSITGNKNDQQDSVIGREETSKEEGEEVGGTTISNNNGVAGATSMDGGSRNDPSSSSVTIVSPSNDEQHAENGCGRPDEEKKPNEDEEDPGIEPNFSFDDAWSRLEVVGGWDRQDPDDDDAHDEAKGGEQPDNKRPVLYWKPPSQRPPSDSAVKGQDYFDQIELEQYLKTQYGWVGPVDTAMTDEEGSTTGIGEEEQKQTNPTTTDSDDSSNRMNLNKNESEDSMSDEDNSNNSNVDEVTPSSSNTNTIPVQETPRRTTQSNAGKRKKTVVTPASLRTSTRERKRPPNFAAEVELYTKSPKMSNNQKSRTSTTRKKLGVQSENLIEQEEFYTFKNLMPILKKNCGWKYHNPTPLRGYKPASKNNYNVYEIPDARREVDGGKHLVDFFFEEEEVENYCKANKYYERRYELGLVSNVEIENEDHDEDVEMSNESSRESSSSRELDAGTICTP